MKEQKSTQDVTADEAAPANIAEVSSMVATDEVAAAATDTAAVVSTKKPVDLTTVIVNTDQPAVAVTKEPVVTTTHQSEIDTNDVPTGIAKNELFVTSTLIDSDETSVGGKTVKEWLEIRKKAGLEIDPETAEVHWCYAQTLDPYGVRDVPREHQQVGREYFARSPGSNIAVSFGDLPEATRQALYNREAINGIPVALMNRATELLEGMKGKTPREVQALAWLRELVQRQACRGDLPW